jgi:tetratricopeptide (TPR) repeat protein
MRRLDAELSDLFPSASELLPPEPPIPRIEGYEVERVLGRGGMGIVFRARHLRLNRPVALKMILAGPYANPDERKRFVQEAEAVASLHHPNIVEVFDAGEIDGRPYFTMELVEGGRLSEKVKGMPQPASEAAALLVAIAQAVHAAHAKGIIHRDLTPSNIMLATDGTPKITDFGLARRAESDSALTVTGLPVGTPSYMAPEQARGQKGAIGPATDVYAMGAILYDLLTGSPPFRGETSTATIQQLLSAEVVPPSRLNSRVPRDLETICLKCLQKEPARRYSSAAELADDLHRFERGEPIKARRVGPTERAVRWARRRPTLAGALAAGIFLGLALLVTALWWHGQRKALQASAIAYAEADLLQSERMRDRGEYEASAAVLQRAKDRLGDFVPPQMRERLSRSFDNLNLVTRLDDIRLERALVKPPTEVLGVLVMPASPTTQSANQSSDEMSSGRHYQEAFRQAGIGVPGDEPAVAAARVKNSPVRGALVAALDDWAACAADREQQAWVLAVVRKVDPDPWRDRVRDPATWNDAEALGKLAAQAPINKESPQILAVLGARLRARQIDAEPFLSRVAAAYPNDFWANIETGNACLQSNAEQAAGYYRSALALRPATLSIHYALGGMYLGLHHFDQCIAEYKEAMRLVPGNAWCHNRLGVALQWKGGQDDEAIAQFRESIRLDPNIGWTHHHLAVSLERKGQLDQAAGEYKEAIRLFAEKRGEWKWDLRRVLMKDGRGSEALIAWKEELVGRPLAYDDWYGYAELCLFLGDQAEYRVARRDLLAQFATSKDPVIAERVGRACLLLPGTEEELRQATALIDLALDAPRPQYDWVRPYFHFSNGLLQYRRGRFGDVIATMTGDAATAAEFLGPCPRLVLAMALYQTGRKDEARKLLGEAIGSYDWDARKATWRSLDRPHPPPGSRGTDPAGSPRPFFILPRRQSRSGKQIRQRKPQSVRVGGSRQGGC